MVDKRQETQVLVLESASRVFRRKGYSGAHMQEIADEANINKSTIYYYFRSKDKLFYKVFQKEIRMFYPQILEILDSKDPLDRKIEQLVDNYYGILQDNPYIGDFIFWEMDKHPDQFQNLIHSLRDQSNSSFSNAFQETIAESCRDPVNSEQLILSIFSLILFPILAQPLVESLFEFDQTGYLKFIEDRKDFLSEFILNGIKYSKT